ncbi:MAG: division/cell wall cluster transcriptional repressor MraZ [Rhodospirillaceae bacterium]|nr:division/cell wall cluster transcriptional repressor MraZ [Rhodospirillaceae bacterium]
MPVFVGTHINKIDRKGRVSVPALFRASFGEAVTAGAYAMRSISGVKALDVFTPDAFARLAESIENPFAEEHDDVTNAIFGASQHIGIDGEGRVMLPDMFRAYAGITDQVCFIGRGNYFQMWNPEDGVAQQEEAFQRAVANRANIRLSLSGRGEGL